MTRSYTVRLTAYRRNGNAYDFCQRKEKKVEVTAESYDDAVWASFRASAEDTQFPLWLTQFVSVTWNKKTARKQYRMETTRSYFIDDLESMGVI